MSPVEILRALDDAIMPVRCVFCGTRTHENEGFVCVGCHADLPWANDPVMPSAPELERVIVPFAYEFPIDAGIKALKFRRKLFYAPAFAQLLCSVRHELPNNIDAVLPVPLHWRRKWWRGFNQALEIAKPVAKRLDLPVIQVARRHRATLPQSGLSAAAREKNLRRAFTAPRRLAYQHVLVIDDVVTTGSTMREVATALLRNGAHRVSGLAVARA